MYCRYCDSFGSSHCPHHYLENTSQSMTDKEALDRLSIILRVVNAQEEKQLNPTGIKLLSEIVKNTGRVVR